MDGCLSYKWSKVQQMYFEWSGIKKSGNKWVSTLIQKLWDVEWEAWDDRNKILHDTPLVGIMSRDLSLDLSLGTEWTLGLHTFPDVMKASIPEDIGRVMESSLIDKK